MSQLSTHKNRKPNTVPFDRAKVPPKQNLFLMPLIWAVCYLGTRKGKLKIHRERMKGLKPPYLVLGTHHAWSDFYVTPLALAPQRANYISELEGFEAFGEWPYRQIGCIGTRKFVNDISLIKNIRRVINRGGIIAYYPEARYANVGTSSKLPVSVGKLAKLLGVPVVTINMHGNYLQSPIWNTAIRKGAIQDATITQIFTREELAAASVEEVNAKISEMLSYDEYKWQYYNKISITYDKRAEGLHQVLYRCPECETEFETSSEGAKIFCKRCGASYTMTEYGRLECSNGKTEFSHIPDWYEWQRSCVINEIESKKYFLDTTVHIEALPNAVNFIDCGEGRLVHSTDGFALTLTDMDGIKKTLTFSPISMTSIHTEYDYRHWGQCVTLSTLDCTYFLFPREKGFNATKIQFATEYLYECAEKCKL